MFYDYYVFTRRRESTREKLLALAAINKQDNRFRRDKTTKSSLQVKKKQHKQEIIEISRDAVRELFGIHHSRAPQKYVIGEYFPPHCSNYNKPNECFFKEWLYKLDRSPYKRLLTKICIGCELDLKVFNAVNRMNGRLSSSNVDNSF